MKRFTRLLPLPAILMLLALTTVGFAAPQAAVKTNPSRPLNVVFLVYNDVEVLDLSGAMDVFVKANRIAANSYNVYTVAVEDGLISTERGAMTIKPRYTIRNSPKPDILVVPGTTMTRVHELMANRNFMQRLKQESARSGRVMSICTGAFLLGKTDLLNHKQSTTQWFAVESLQQEFPKTTVMQGVRFVEDSNIITTAGVTSGIDGALHLVERTQSKQVADTVARAMQYRRGMPSYPEQPRGKVVVSRSSDAESHRHMPMKTPMAKGASAAVDPVCGMAIGSSPKATYEYQGHVYGFCSPDCQKLFAAHPQQYLTTSNSEPGRK